VKRWVAALATSSMLATVLVVSAQTPALSAPAPLNCKQITRERIDFRLCRGKVTARDGTVKLDTDVTLPGRGRGPFPLIVMLHALGGAKQSYECLGEQTPGAGGSSPGCKVVEGTGGTYRYNNLWFASRGYAVLNYTARGFHNSKCVNDDKPSQDADDVLYPPSTYGPSPACMLQLDHVDHEVTDTQYLVGRLVDGTLLELSNIEFIARKIGVTGVSYGGGHTWLLTRENSWRSPKGRSIRVGAAVPIIGFTDLADSIAPNGRARDDVVQTTDAGERGAQAVGVLKESYVEAFVLALTLTAAEFGALPGYLKAWNERFGNGEPYDDALVQDALDKLLLERSAYYVPSAGKRTPILAVQAFTDGVFPAIESLRMYTRLVEEDADYPIRVYLGDWGHPIAQNKAGETLYIARLVNRWFGHYLKKVGAEPAGIVEARRTSCGESIGRLYRGTSWEDLRTEPFATENAVAGVLGTPSADPHAAAVDPDPSRPNAGRCRTTGTAVAPDNVAVNVAVPPEGLTMLGLPEVTLTADPSAAEMYVVARLWDVDPAAGEQTLVTRGVWRLGGDEAGQIVVMQLFGNAYRFRPGHEIRLELTADDARAFKNWEQLNVPAPGEIAISNVGLSIPVADAANLVGEAPVSKRTLEAVGPVRVAPVR
jgi:predicted acyl esterase